LPGQIGQHPQTGKLVEGGVTEQARQILENLRSLLEELFLQPDNIIKVNIFLTDMADFAAVNAVYGEYFTEIAPARSTVAVAGLPRGVRVEIEVVALT
jgi:2-iminobutanoate/2-iminopropanoate deaminase